MACFDGSMELFLSQKMARLNLNGDAFGCNDRASGGPPMAPVTIACSPSINNGRFYVVIFRAKTHLTNLRILPKDSQSGSREFESHRGVSLPRVN